MIGDGGANRGISIRVRGLVQGVGFRPTVWRLAQRFGLSGEVLNDGEGVLIHAWGPAAALAEFELALSAEAPPLSRIDAIECTPLAAAFDGDRLPDRRKPAGRGQDRHRRRRRDLPRLPRRYPRSRPTAATAIPSPTARIAGRGFRLSARSPTTARRRAWRNSRCARPASRNTAIRPTAASTRSPMPAPNAARRFGLKAPAGRSRTFPPIAMRWTPRRRSSRPGRLSRSRGIGGFHLACDACNADAVARLRERKARYGKPFALMARDLEAIADYAELGEAERALLSRRRRAYCRF